VVKRRWYRRVLRPCGAPPRGTNLVDLDLDWPGLGALLDSQFEYAVSIGRADAIAARVEWKPEYASDGAVAAGPLYFPRSRISLFPAEPGLPGWIWC
jgi:hypothetical protein